MWPFSWIQKWMDGGKRLRLLTAEVNERINGLAAPLREGASDTQIQASIQVLNDVTHTVKFGGPTGTVRRKA